MVFENIDDETKSIIQEAIKPFDLSVLPNVIMNRWIFAKDGGKIVVTRDCWDKRWVGSVADIVKRIKDYYR